jgi:hypothetical protein
MLAMSMAIEPGQQQHIDIGIRRDFMTRIRPAQISYGVMPNETGLCPDHNHTVLERKL